MAKFCFKFFAVALLMVTSSSLSAAILSHSGIITAPETWSGTDIHLVSGIVEVNSGASLTIEPGAIVKFNFGAGLVLHGGLTAVGSQGNEIIFTSYRDDSAGGDTNGDGSSSGQNADWENIIFTQTVDLSSRLEFADIRYAGGSDLNMPAIHLLGANIPITNNQISNCSDAGIYIDFSNTTIEGNTISNTSHGIFVNDNSTPTIRGNNLSNNGYGIYVDWNSNTVIENNIITNNSLDGIHGLSATSIDNNTINGNGGYGIYYRWDSSNVSITNNIITGNDAPLFIPASILPDTSNTLSPNTRNHIELYGDDILTNKTLRLWSKGSADQINSYSIIRNSLVVPQNVTLTIDPGVIVKYDTGLGMTVNGALIADGRASEEIIFTSILDDYSGGDTNQDGNATVPINGNWSGITFNDSTIESSTILNHVNVKYAGASGNGGLNINVANIQVQNSEISNNSNYGIRVFGASPIIEYNNIWGNTGDGIRIEDPSSNPTITFNTISTNTSDGIEVLSAANALVTNNQFLMNRDFGINNTTLNVIDATNSWWGEIDSSGPLHATTNPSGAGNPVSDNVTFSPFQTTAPFEYGYVNFSQAAGSTAGQIAYTLDQGILSDEWDTVSLRPDRTMVWDLDRVKISYPSLDQAKNYKVRVSYFNGDWGPLHQSLDQISCFPGDPLFTICTLNQGMHPAQLMQLDAPYQYEYHLLPTFGGNTTLEFINNNSVATENRAALPEVWLIEDNREYTEPVLESVVFDDIDGSGGITFGDEFYFNYSEAVDSSLIQDGTTDANIKLALSTGAIYGTTNQVRWSTDMRTVIVTLTSGFNLLGNETITPVGLQDLFGKAVTGSQVLTISDSVSPKLISAVGPSPVAATDSIQITLQFNSSLNNLISPVITLNAEDGSQQIVLLDGGVWGTTVYPNDTYIRSSIQLGEELDGTFIVGVSGAEDLSGNIMDDVVSAYSFDMTPDVPVITNYSVSPSINYVSTTNVTIEGTRDNNTSIITPSGWSVLEVVPLGSGPWSYDRTLNPNTTQSFILRSRDANSNVSDAVTISFLVDTLAPVLQSVTPENGSIVNSPPSNIQISFNESGGISIADSALSVTREGVSVQGDWSGDTTGTPGVLVFTPTTGFAEGTYQLSAQLQDLVGNQDALFVSAFEIDLTPPAPPVVNAVPDIVETTPFVISGTKEANSAIWLNGQEVVASAVDTNWSYSTPLVDGLNTLSFTAVDQAGNTSQPTAVQTTLDVTPPGPVTITGDGVGDGTTAMLDWAGYDEVANGGDISLYTIYISGTSFTDVANAFPIDTVPAGTKTYTAQGLLRNATNYFAVVATDTNGSSLTTVSSIAVTTQDTVAPQEVTNTSIQSFADRLVATWNPSPDAGVDLANYKVYFNNDAGTLVDPGTNTHEMTGLAAATAYPIRIASIDNDGNESTGISLTGVTHLPNPTGVTSTPLSSMVDITWTAAQPSNLISQYAVYVSSTNFTSVTGMTPYVQVSNATTSSRIAGLTNGVTYYIAVTTINTSGGEDTNVITVSETPQSDLTPPDITGVTYNGSALVDGATITQSGTIAATATDDTGLSRIQFNIDGTELVTDSNGSDGYSAAWNILNTTDGPHTINITAYDTLDNQTSQDISVTVALAAPAAPAITNPQTGTTTNDSLVNILGTAEDQTEVFVYLNAAQVAGPITVDANGNFATNITINEGLNTITAAAQNRGGLGPQSSAIQVTLDTSVPDAPTGLSASSRESGQVALTWNPSSDSRVVGYDVYRSSTSFTDITSAVRANTNVITASRFDDLPVSDGTYFYRVVAVNDLGTASTVSNEVTGIADSVMPRADSIEYTSSGNVDPATGRMAPGLVNVTVNVSEALLTTPFLSITPNGGVPITVTLTEVNDTTYSGSFTITDSTITGTAYAVFSARDVVGNRGSDVLEGATINIDTDGPIVNVLDVTPGSPIKTDQTTPVTVNMEIELGEAPQTGTEPQLSYLLSGAGRVETIINNLVPLGNLRWRGSFTLPTDAGLTEVENLSFLFVATDDLGNVSNQISAANSFQVYQGDLPPLSAPTGFTGTASPGGTVNLSWNAVESAVEYQLYRQAPGETGLTELQRVTTGTTHTDNTLQDGDHIYTVASVRQENGQEAISAQSGSITVSADATVPNAPQNLSLELVGAGIKALWEAPTGETTGLTYNLYRASGTSLTDVTGLTPIQTNIVANAQGVLGYIDTHPDLNEPTYAVTAVDAAGNESLPSNSDYLNVALLPVADLTVTEDGSGAPVISWTHSGTNIDGYNVYLGADQSIQLNTSLVTNTNFTDTGYSGDTRIYTITAVDINTVESIGRTVVLPQLSAQLSATSTLKRGVMNQLDYTVTNNGTDAVSGIRLSVDANGHSNSSSTFNLDPGASTTVPVVIGGFADLPDLVTLINTLTVTGDTGEQVNIIRNQDIAVSEDSLLLNVQTQELTRGTAGQVRFTLENTSQVETEILSALNANNASNQVRVFLQDLDGNVLSTVNYFQPTGNVVSLTNGNVVARIPAGQSFTSDWIGLPIPQSAPDDVIVVLEIDNFHYHLGQSDHVAIGGMQSTRSGSLVDTAYTATVDSITPQSSYGDEPITITGQAIDRSTSQPLASVPVKIVVSVNGFERSAEVFTGTDGSYSYVYTPQQNESGIFTVSAIHPAILARPAQGQFIVGQVVTNYSSLNLRLARNNTETINLIRATVGEGITATNLRLVYEAADQPNGVFPQGMTVTPGAPITLNANESAVMPFDIVGDDTASQSGTLVLKLMSDESGTEPLATINVNYQEFDAVPTLFFSPNFVETGVAHDSSVSEFVTLENRGLTAMTDVSVSLLDESGNLAPSWVYLTSATNQGNIAVGEQRQIQLVAAPTTTVLDGVYHFLLRVTSSNHPTRNINVYVSVTQSGIGNALFKASDIYTATLDENGVPIPGLAGARIKVQNEDVITIEEELTTDNTGEALFTDLPAGRYRFRASAPNHEDLLGRFTIKPGITVSQDAFLNYNLITIEWAVNEITIEDSYTIVLQATFETDVPAAVVVIEPTSTTLPTMAIGDVFNGEMRITNYGLIRADNLTFNLPTSDAYFRYEFPVNLPTSLEAKESIVLPYKVIALASLDSTGTGTGASCNNYGQRLVANYEYICANGTVSRGLIGHSWVTTISNSCPSSGGGGAGGGGGGGGTFGGYSGGGGSTSLPSADCPNDCSGCCSGQGSGDGGGQ